MQEYKGFWSFFANTPKIIWKIPKSQNNEINVQKNQRNFKIKFFDFF